MFYKQNLDWYKGICSQIKLKIKILKYFKKSRKLCETETLVIINSFMCSVSTG